MNTYIETQQSIEGVINRWCPEFSRKTEPFENQIMRVILNLNAFEADYKLVLEGKQPIRTDYPIPFPTKS